jgi:hypothetical protein
MTGPPVGRVSLLTGDRGRAATLLRRGAAAALVGGLLAGSLACTQDKGDLPTAPARLAATFTLAADPAAIPADGISTSRITVRITSDDPDPSRLTVAFSTDAGTLVGGTTNAQGEHEVGADAGTRTAEVQLRSSLAANTTARVTARLVAAGVAKTVAVRFEPADASSVIRFVAPPARGQADGESSLPLVVEVAPSFAIGTQIRFTTTRGLFLPEALTEVMRAVDGAHRVTVELQSPDTPATALVTASTPAGVPASARIVFDPALPDFIQVSTPAQTVAAGGTIAVTATLLRDPGRGTVSAGLPVTFAATVGGFANQTAVLDQEPRTATADYLPGAAAAGTEVTITVRASGGGATGSTVLTVTGS